MVATVTGVCAIAPVAAAAANSHAAAQRNAAKDPSGVPMPVGNVRGWKQVLADNFTGYKLDSKWAAYAGPVSGGEGGWWASSHAVVHHNELVLRTYRDSAACGDPTSCPLFGDEVSAGVKSRLALRYGKVLVRAKTAPVADVAFLGILWPASDQAPPETDFIEEGGVANLTTIGATVKYALAPPSTGAGATGATGPTEGSTGITGPDGVFENTINSSVTANAARWHTFGVTWSPSKIVYTIDGHVWGTVANPVASAAPMNIVLQAQTDCEATPGLTCSAPWTTTEPDVDVAWVTAYTPKS